MRGSRVLSRTSRAFGGSASEGTWRRGCETKSIRVREDDLQRCRCRRRWNSVAKATSSSKPRVAIAGVTGAVGQEFLQVLKERNFPYDDMKMLASARYEVYTFQHMHHANDTCIKSLTLFHVTFVSILDLLARRFTSTTKNIQLRSSRKTHLRMLTLLFSVLAGQFRRSLLLQPRATALL